MTVSVTVAVLPPRSLMVTVIVCALGKAPKLWAADTVKARCR
jgi:hypothetical protein